MTVLCWTNKSWHDDSYCAGRVNGGGHAQGPVRKASGGRGGGVACGRGTLASGIRYDSVW